MNLGEGNEFRDIAYNAGIKKNWDDYRAVYDELTIKDIIDLNTAWDVDFPCQNRASNLQFVKMFKDIKGDGLKVVELGCYQAQLCWETMTHLRPGIVKHWVGFDANHYAIDVANRRKIQKFKGIKMRKWFWEVDLAEFNVFVSAHTLEHFNGNQVFQILETVSKYCEYILLEVPFAPNWGGYRGSHVLESSKEVFTVNLMELGYDQFYVQTNKGVWVSGWRKGGR
jgi:hypothetical protein